MDYAVTHYWYQRQIGFANSGWKYDAFPELKSLDAHRRITITAREGPGLITCIHITQLWGTIEGPMPRPLTNATAS